MPANLLRQTLLATLPKIRRSCELTYDAQPNLNEPGHCASRAAVLHLISMLYGFDSLVQGGSCYWPRVPWEGSPQVDGDYGYEWEDNDASWAKIRAGVLPEIHVWVAFPREGLLIDPSSGLIPEHCMKQTGRSWTAERPEPFFLHQIEDRPPPGVIYRADETATLLAFFLTSNYLAEMLEENSEYWPMLLEQKPHAASIIQRRPIDRLGLPGCPVRYPPTELVRALGAEEYQELNV